MTVIKIWRRFQIHNEAFVANDDSPVSMTVGGCRKMVETSYRAGFEAGQEAQAALMEGEIERRVAQRLQNISEGMKSPKQNQGSIMDLFEEVFGGKK